MSPLARVTLVTMSRRTLVTRHESLPGLTITLLSTAEKYEVGHRADCSHHHQFRNCSKKQIILKKILTAGHWLDRLVVAAADDTTLSEYLILCHKKFLYVASLPYFLVSAQLKILDFKINLNNQIFLKISSVAVKLSRSCQSVPPLSLSPIS